MDTFPNYIPSQSSTYSSSFSVNKANFGDGYNQRSVNGLNNIKRTLSLTWEKRPAAEIDEIEAFLVDKAGVESFLYTPAGEATELKWTCLNPVKTPLNGIYSTITATFEQEFDL